MLDNTTQIVKPITDELLWNTVAELREEANKLENRVNDETNGFINSVDWNANDEEWVTNYSEKGEAIVDLIDFIRFRVIHFNIRYKKTQLCRVNS